MRERLVWKVSECVIGDGAIGRCADDAGARRMVQRTMYVFSEAVREDLFGYCMYINGPYSDLVMEIIGKLVRMGAESWERFRGTELTETGAETIEKVREYLRHGKDELALGISKGDFYDLMATMLYNRRYERGIEAMAKWMGAMRFCGLGVEESREFVNRYYGRIDGLGAVLYGV